MPATGLLASFAVRPGVPKVKHWQGVDIGSWYD